MFRGLLTTLVFWLAVSTAWAEDAALRRLDTMDDSRGWEAVGRLELGGAGFCTGALIAPDLVLTAAHCLFDKRTKQPIDHDKIEFLAGWRNGRASAYRNVRRAVVHPAYVYDGDVSSERVRNDLALLELSQPIRNTSIRPFGTAVRPATGDSVGVVSYAKSRSEVPSLQEVCTVLSRQEGVLVTSCNVDFGSSGAPIFSFDGGEANIVSVVSAKAELDGKNVSLGTSLAEPLEELRAELLAGGGFQQGASPAASRVRVGVRNDTGAKFVKP